jgi:hypothetical protein
MGSRTSTFEWGGQQDLNEPIFWMQPHKNNYLNNTVEGKEQDVGWVKSPSIFPHRPRKLSRYSHIKLPGSQDWWHSRFVYTSITTNTLMGYNGCIMSTKSGESWEGALWMRLWRLGWLGQTGHLCHKDLPTDKVHHRNLCEPKDIELWQPAQPRYNLEISTHT